MKLRQMILCLAGSYLAWTGNLMAQSNPLRIWFDEPAKQWEETLPLGNGRLGMMPDGGVMQEKIVLNDITLWSGAPQDANNYEAYKKLPEIRELIINGRNDEAQDLVNQSFVCLGKGSGDEPFGKFQTLGDLNINYFYDVQEADGDMVEGYTRELTLNDAMARTEFDLNGVHYKREYFTSFDDDLGIIRLSANESGKLNFELSLAREERANSKVDGEELVLTGQLDNGTDGKGMQFEARVKVMLKGGSIRSGKNKLVVSNASEAIVLVSAGTDFKNPDYKQEVAEFLELASNKTYKKQVKNHTKNYDRFFGRLDFKLAGNELSQLTTDKRLDRFFEDINVDNGLPVLFMQYGRYLTISSTRIGLLPPNLQGLWANQINTPWNGDYHLDVNVQMNHWPVEIMNLSELNLPLAELVRGLVEPGKRTARAYYNADGWVAHVITNIWGFTEPGESASWGLANAGSGWVCNNLWQHYQYTEDEDYLESIYPILKGSAEFYNSVLMKDPETGWFVTGPSVSPENWFVMPNGRHASICMGPTIDNQIVRELFGNVIEAAETLGRDKNFVSDLKIKLDLIPPVGRIGKDGTLMEWLRDRPEGDPQHRHISHLYGVYPASLITPEKTPDLAEASKKVLEVRGDDGPSWAIAYKMIFWARLMNGDRAYQLFHDLMRPTLKTDINYGAGGGVYPNLLTAGPPFQIDGNFGGITGLAEMLIQSHHDYIELLPAIPEQWKEGGEIKGFKARGNYQVSMKWENGKVIFIEISSPDPTKKRVKVKVNGELKDIKVK
ncbi:glycoside hydrolase N-terminal domain-containing protein [Echinicola sp. 20G]|uniref:glycoside hydrolase family 95 protein n=1 Tax=Echinicola sp. 20G TaxID=2781961 RepID=UPI001F198607|nr:glycoside hydrolase N-terminal domain-containing protein [Echinicola sp. 20G]